MGFVDTIKRLSTGSYTVTRVAPGSYTNGRYTPGATSTITLPYAVVQPLTPRVMLPLPDGVRSEDVRLIHTTTALRVQDENGAGDMITIGGEPFYVWRVSGPWTVAGSTHYEVHAARRLKP